MFFKWILTFKWKLAQKFSNLLLNKINFDTALNFNQVDLPYPIWNRVKTTLYTNEPPTAIGLIESLTVYFFIPKSSFAPNLGSSGVKTALYTNEPPTADSNRFDWELDSILFYTQKVALLQISGVQVLRQLCTQTSRLQQTVIGLIESLTVYFFIPKK
jgi:hypothetical protein